jgi:hypothetical protein
MTAKSDPPRSKGMTMIAAYRAQRLSQRPTLRQNLRQSHAALRHTREEALRVTPAGFEPPPLPGPAEVPPSEPVGTAECGSVFANLVSAAAEDLLAAQSDAAEPAEITVAATIVATVEPAPAAADVAPPAASDPPAARDILTPDCPPADAPTPAEHATDEPNPINDPSLAEIGFGPGMVIRLSQIGMHTTGDLARSDVAELRAALGDISRLVDVEAWIRNARERLHG